MIESLDTPRSINYSQQSGVYMFHPDRTVITTDQLGRRTKVVVLLGIVVMALSGCMNMPTPPSQITGSYVSTIRYEDYDLKRLTVEYDALCRREGQLVIAQEQRRKSSQVQAFWWGYGQGDGIEASELANVRGEKEAVRQAMDLKGYRPTELNAGSKAAQ